MALLCPGKTPQRARGISVPCFSLHKGRSPCSLPSTALLSLPQGLMQGWGAAPACSFLGSRRGMDLQPLYTGPWCLRPSPLEAEQDGEQSPRRPWLLLPQLHPLSGHGEGPSLPFPQDRLLSPPARAQCPASHPRSGKLLWEALCESSGLVPFTPLSEPSWRGTSPPHSPTSPTHQWGTRLRAKAAEICALPASCQEPTRSAGHGAHLGAGQCRCQGACPGQQLRAGSCPAMHWKMVLGVQETVGNKAGMGGTIRAGI